MPPLKSLNRLNGLLPQTCDGKVPFFWWWGARKKRGVKKNNHCVAQKKTAQESRRRSFAQDNHWRFADAVGVVLLILLKKGQTEKRGGKQTMD